MDALAKLLDEGTPCSGSKPYKRECSSEECVTSPVAPSRAAVPVWVSLCASDESARFSATRLSAQPPSSPARPGLCGAPLQPSRARGRGMRSGMRSQHDSQRGEAGSMNVRGKVDATTGCSNHTALGIDAEGDDNTATRLDAATDVGNDAYLRTGRSRRDDFPAIPGNVFHASPPRGVDDASDTRNAQTNENEIKLQQAASSGSATQAATAAGSLPTHAVGIAESATRSLSMVRSATISASVSMGIQRAAPAPRSRSCSRQATSPGSHAATWSGETKNGFS